MKPPARALAGNLIWSADGGVWALWRVRPFAHAYCTTTERLAVHARLRGLLIGLPEQSMLLSVCERVEPWDVAADMADGVDLGEHQAWAEACRMTVTALTGQDLYRRRHYLAVELPGERRRAPWRRALRTAALDVVSTLGLAPAGVDQAEIASSRRQAQRLQVGLAQHIALEPVTTGEIRWLYARALRRGGQEPAFDQSWKPPRPARHDGAGGLLAPLVDAVVKEGGYRDDPDRPRHRRYVRIDSGRESTYATYLVVGDMPHQFTFPDGGGEWLTHLDDVGVPIDWCVRVRSIPNSEAQAKLRRQHRQLIGQVDEYDGEVSGAPPSLAEAITAIDDQRANLTANPAEPELQATTILSIADRDLDALEDRAEAITALFEPHDYGIFRPTGGQLALLRSMLPGTTTAPVCRDYTQFLLPGDLAAGAPYCGADLGDPCGLLLGFRVDTGTPTPVLLDPTYGPSVGRTASLAAVGALGSGKSYFLKRLCWDTIARGGQVVTIDRTAIGEYVTFADTTPGRCQVIRLSADSDVCLDPLRCFAGDERITVTLGFLSLLAGCSGRSEEGAALAEAVHHIAADSARLGDVIDHLHHAGDSTTRPDPAARSLARRLDHYRRLGPGRLAFGDGDPVQLDADFLVFWAPHLALADRDTLINEHLARQMLPEEILGHALIYLVAAVSRRVVFSNPTRFGAALYDEAWVLLASPYGQRLVLEGIRDGRKHNGAIWLASQHPNDLGAGELVDLLGTRLVFRQSHGAIDPATEFLGVAGSDDATEILRRGLPTGRCLLRDVRDRLGLVDIIPPISDAARQAADTTPTQQPTRSVTAQVDTSRPPQASDRTPPGSARTPTPQPPGPRRRRRTPLANVLDDTTGPT